MMIRSVQGCWRIKFGGQRRLTSDCACRRAVCRANVSMLLLVVTVSFVACADSEYSVTIRNETSGMLTDAEVAYGSFKSVGGWIAPGSSKTHAGVKDKPDRTVTVQWRAADGVLHRAIVPLPVEEQFSGDLLFTIKNDGSVSVAVTPNGP